MRLVLLNLVVSVICSATELTKPYTLKIQTLLPVGGPLAAFGNLCIEPMKFLIDKVNQQNKILPDYNLVVDVVDDECNGATGLKGILPFFFNDRVLAQNQSKVGQYRFPENVTLAHKSAATHYVTPMLMGGVCSDVCQVTGRTLQHFDLVAYSTACNADELSNSKMYPNFYRTISQTFITSVTLDFMMEMGWDNVAIISDTQQMNLDTTEGIMLGLIDRNMTVVGIEIFIDDPKEPVGRIAKTGSRVIIANCFLETCPKIACEAYKIGYYGQRIIWVFPQITDMNSESVSHLPEICQLHLQKVRDRSFFYRMFTASHEEFDEKIGSPFNFTIGEIDRHLESMDPGVKNHHLYGPRFMCLWNLAPAVFTLEVMEKKLNKAGTTLRDFISSNSVHNQQSELARSALLEFVLKTFDVDMNKTYDNSIIPAGFTQFKKSNQTLIFKTISTNFEKQPIDWWTPDGKAPKMRPTRVEEVLTVPRWSLYLMVALFVLKILLLLGLIIYIWKSERRLGWMMKMMHSTIFVGMIFVSIAVLLYPNNNDHSNFGFCTVSPCLISLGYCMQNWGMFFMAKIKVIPRFKDRKGRKIVFINDAYQKVISSRLASLFIFILAILFINVMLLVFWYLENLPTYQIKKAMTTYDVLSDIETEFYQFECTPSRLDEGVPVSLCLLIALHAFPSAALLLKVTTMAKRKGTAEVLSASFVLVSTYLAGFLIATAAKRTDLIFLLLSCIFFISQSFITFCFKPFTFSSKTFKYQSPLKTTRTSQVASSM